MPFTVTLVSPVFLFLTTITFGEILSTSSYDGTLSRRYSLTVLRPRLSSYIARKTPALSTSLWNSVVCDGFAWMTLSKFVKIGMLY